jgi:hypothetical protein
MFNSYHKGETNCLIARLLECARLDCSVAELGSLSRWQKGLVMAITRDIYLFQRAGPEKLDKGLRCVPPFIGGTEHGEASPFYG